LPDNQKKPKAEVCPNPKTIKVVKASTFPQNRLSEAPLEIDDGDINSFYLRMIIILDGMFLLVKLLIICQNFIITEEL